jgi:Uncharacterized protein conserved in bacteria (DUF2330)
MQKFIFPAVLLAGLILGRDASPTLACAAAFRDNEPVQLADQAVFIFWDAANKIEHLIRKATFETNTKDFGFIVPTPTQPALAEANDSAFEALEALTARQTQWEWRFKPLCCVPIGCGTLSSSLNGRSGHSAVRVLDSQRVAGLDAAVLEADDAAALAAWLKDHGYAFRPELTAWLEYYVARQWKVTAFKIAHDPQTGKPVTTSAVRMSFAAERPFFPYRVPDETDRQRRLLRIFMLAGQRVEGRLGEKGDWSGKAVWADRLTKEHTARLARDLGLDEATLPADAWLTTFDDLRFPNPGSDDVYFRGASSQGTLHRPPLHRTIWIPPDVAVIALVWGTVLVYGRWRAKRNGVPRSPSASR